MPNIQLTKNLGLLLLGIWMITYGVMALGSFIAPGMLTLMSLFAIVIGVLLAIGR